MISLSFSSRGGYQRTEGYDHTSSSSLTNGGHDDQFTRCQCGVVTSFAAAHLTQHPVGDRLFFRFTDQLPSEPLHVIRPVSRGYPLKTLPMRTLRICSTRREMSSILWHERKGGELTPPAPQMSADLVVWEVLVARTDDTARTP